ncbi:MAG: hypothetical protein CL523_06820 [Actinomycetales bacterium]|nr:MAG: hypothetical protein CL523_06820 [Actinomycetales bacterium]
MSSLLIQFMDSPQEGATTPITTASTFRRDLRNWIAHRQADHPWMVTIIETDEQRLHSIANLWSDGDKVEIINGQFSTRLDVDSSLMTWWLADNTDAGVRIIVGDRREAERFSPNVAPEAITLEAVTYTDIEQPHANPSELVLSFHADSLSAEDITDAVSRLTPTSVLVSRPNPDVTRRLAHVGFAFAGRPWGQAGESATYVASSSMTASDRRRALTVKSGQSIESFRSHLPAPDERRAAARKLRHRVSRAALRDVLDPSFGVSKDSPSLGDVRAFIDAVPGPADVTWDIEVDDREEVDRRIHDCFDNFGVWPISFSMHRSNILEPSTVQDRSDLISPIVPGYPYSFTNFAEYLETYARSHFAITHRKAGWDCFRHLEIMASGSAPLMLDASDIPQFSMVHYPKQAFRQILTNARMGGVPSMRTYEALHNFMTENVTTRAMTHYLLQCTQITDMQRVLFVDQQHPNAVDYLSTLTLIGLKEHFGRQCFPLFPAPWIYRDYDGDVSHLYGRGFGTTRLLDPDLRADNELSGTNAELRYPDFDTLVVGSISRNTELAKELARHFAPDRTIWIHGEDTPPLADQVRSHRAFGTHLFIRSIDV